LNRNYVILTVVLIAIISIASVYGALTLLNTGEPSATASPTTTSTPTSTATATPDPSSTANPTSTTTPTAEPTPTTTTEPQTLIVTDATGAQVTVNLPVERIVCLTSGLTEIVCALGGEDLIVGRGQYSTFPPSIVDVPVAGSTSASPNVEVILDLEPDLVLVDTMIVGKTALTQLQDAGLTVIVEAPANLSRIAPIIETLGQIVGNEEKATELVNWMNSYLDLITTRLADVTSDEMPSVYMEYNTDWSSFGPEHSVGQLLTAAGGNNIVTNTSTSTVKVSAEYVLESNPEYMFKMTAAGKTVNETYYQEILTTVVDRTGFSEIAAVQNNHVYLYDYSLIQGIRYPIGQVFFAKCMYPELFADVDPTATLAELYQDFFGIESEGVYVYP
jgi:iron complex transport system substrate-binding protein